MPAHKAARAAHHQPEAEDLSMSNRQPHTRTTTERGFGRDHQKRRAAIKPMVDAGAHTCCRCGQRIRPGQPWHLDHSDTPGSHQRGEYVGVSHSWCNLAARNRHTAALARRAQGRGTPGPERPRAAPAEEFFHPRKKTP